MDADEESSDDLIEWVQPVHPDIPIKVKEIDIPCVPPPEQKNKKLYAIFKECFSNRESMHHSYLKWFSLNWIQKDQDTLAYIYNGSWTFGIEGQLFLPRYFDKTAKYGRSLRGQFLPEMHVGLPDHGIIPDVYSINEVCVECGQTNPVSLMAPLYTYAVKVTIWIPFPHKDKNAEWPIFEGTIPGYKFSRLQPKNLRKEGRKEGRKEEKITKTPPKQSHQ